MDRRDYMNHYREDLQEGFDPNKMVWIVEVEHEDGTEEIVELPAKFVVCDTCNGRGKHVNPSIDAHGISAEEFAEDPEFAEEYFNGMYDVECYECQGKNVVGEINYELIEQANNPKWKMALEFYEELMQSLADSHRMEMAERRYCGGY